MQVKGVIIEDKQGRELLMVCPSQRRGLGRVLALRGWQRRRLVPLHHTEQELRPIFAGVLLTLSDLIPSLTRFVERDDNTLPDQRNHGKSLRTFPKRPRWQGPNRKLANAVMMKWIS